jgi:hypothetical protein
LVVVEEASRGRERAWKSRAAPPQSHSRSPRNINTKTSPHAVRHIDIEHEEIALETTMALSYLRQLYSLDTLDTRFVVPATVPPKEALEEANVDPAISRAEVAPTAFNRRDGRPTNSTFTICPYQLVSSSCSSWY